MTNLQNNNVLKNNKFECSSLEGSEDKENIPEHAECSYLGLVYQDPNQTQIQTMYTIFECAEATSTRF